MDIDYLLTTIDRTLRTSNSDLDRIFNTPNDSFKVGRLLEITGQLQGELVFLKGQLEEPKKKSRNPFKR